jgi:hypothetical protein
MAKHSHETQHIDTKTHRIAAEIFSQFDPFFSMISESPFRELAMHIVKMEQ